MNKGMSSAALLMAIIVAFHHAQKPVQAAAQPYQASANAGRANAAIDSGSAVFLTNCAFCHGRDAAGGETGPDLTRSKLISDDKDGDLISAVVRNGRPDKGMPAFNLNDSDLNSLQAFIHNRALIASTQKGGRRGVDGADLQTGDKDAGMRYFQGEGGCAKCHSPTGDLAGIATRYQGLRLEQRMLYPNGSKAKATVTTASGQTVNGTLAYRDEFTIALRDANGTYHSWPMDKVKVAIDDPVQAHVALFPKYTDDDIHNLMAYLQTLR
jgi:cytochrome c oxidase cbb3-type subunit III